MIEGLANFVSQAVVESNAFGEGCEELLAVAVLEDAGVEDDHAAFIFAGSNQAAKSLFEAEDGEW